MRDDKTKKQAFVGFILFTVLASGVILFAPWKPRTDFDIIGVLWIMQNIVPFVVSCVLVAVALGAGTVWLRYKIRELRK
jgi:hypothetical protein